MFQRLYVFLSRVLFLCVTVYLSNSNTDSDFNSPSLERERERERAFEIINFIYHDHFHILYENDPVLSDCLVLFHIHTHTHPINTAKREGFATVKHEYADTVCMRMKMTLQ